MSLKQKLTLKLESDRMIYLDVLRVMAAYMIILYHFQSQMDFGAAAGAVRARLAGFTLAVDLFFFLSGFVLSSVYTGNVRTLSDYREFMVKRVARIIPLHWATFGIFALFGLLYAAGKLPSNHPEIYDPSCILPNLLLLHSYNLCSNLTFNYVSWSISAEMGMYILFPLLAMLAVKRAALPVVVAIIVILTIVSERDGWLWLEWMFDGGVLRALPSFLLGVISYYHRQMLGRLPHAARWLGLACLVWFVGSMLQCPKMLMLPLVYGIGGLGIAASEQPSSLIARRVALLTQTTYSLYMLHPLVQSVLLTGIGAGALKLTGVAMNLFVLAAMVLLIPISWLSLVFFERPSRRWVTKKLAKPRRAPPENAMFTPDSRW